jgi:hypothetical protein
MLNDFPCEGLVLVFSFRHAELLSSICYAR